MKDERQEIREAIQAADHVLNCLSAAQDCLQSAGRWGIMDIFGGGTISTFMKHSKMNRAEQELTAARGAMRQFARELRDVDDAFDINLRVDDFLSFADYFFDGMIADWMMQKRISDAKCQVAEAMERVGRIRAQLQGL